MDTIRRDELARTAMRDRKGHAERERGYLYYHGLRTAKLALNLLDRVPGAKTNTVKVDRNLLFTAALFHDVGRWIEPHAETGAAIARETLAEICTAAELDFVVRIIQMHNKRGESTDIHEQVVQDADLLDHFGAQNIWLCFHDSAGHDRPGTETLAYYRGEDNKTFIENCRGILNFEISREIFDKRIAFEQSFFTRFEQELDGAP